MSYRSCIIKKVTASFKPVGPFIKASEVADPHDVTLICTVNGKEVARDTTKMMKFTIAEQIADASALTRAPYQRADPATGKPRNNF